MPTIENLKIALEKYNVDEKIINQIYSDYEGFSNKSSKEEKIVFFSHAMQIIDKNIDQETKYKVLDSCACCKGGKRKKAIDNFVKMHSHKPLSEKIKLMTSVDNLGRLELLSGNFILVSINYKIDNIYKCACPCFHKAKIDANVSKTYCYCCAGHFRHHYQNAFGIKLKTKEIKSSPLDSKGQEPCRIVLEIIENE